MILGGHFDLDNKEARIHQLTEIMNQDNFWNDANYANDINKELTALKRELNLYYSVQTKIKDNLELIDLLEESELQNLESEIETIQKEVEELEISTLLGGENDKLNCYLEIHPGAGGTESCDWASMLYRMYTRFCDKNDFKYEINDIQYGDEAGIKSVVLHVKGLYAFGYLACEKGVHRLVRISPFDSNARRHTSFASVSVIPEFDDSVEIEIKETDLKIDVYHSSGAGGQSVNTTNSAVRITHLPTNTVVTCQNERSQLKNKDVAMKILKSKLYQIELEKKELELNKLKGENININFGSQIRNYVLEPYKLVKDVRSQYESSQVDKILDGDILPIIESVLRTKVK